jgi:hypothetical protein
MQITGAPASFDTAGFAQSIPAFTGTGKLRLTGGAAVTFSQSTLTYGLIFDGIVLNLGTLDAGTTPLTTPNLEIIGPATLNVTLPASPTGRYPLIACTSSLDGSLGQITVSGGGAGVLVRDGNTLYGSGSIMLFDMNGNLVRSGGMATSSKTQMQLRGLRQGNYVAKCEGKVLQVQIR